MDVTDPELGGRSAMVFRFQGDTTSGFWMKDTLLPLSIAWYAADGTLVSTADMEPCPADTLDCPVFDAEWSVPLRHRGGPGRPRPAGPGGGLHHLARRGCGGPAQAA